VSTSVKVYCKKSRRSVLYIVRCRYVRCIAQHFMQHFGRVSLFAVVVVSPLTRSSCVSCVCESFFHFPSTRGLRSFSVASVWLLMTIPRRHQIATHAVVWCLECGQTNYQMGPVNISCQML